MEALREQYRTQVPPVVGVTVDGAKGLVSPTRGPRINPWPSPLWFIYSFISIFWYYYYYYYLYC